MATLRSGLVDVFPGDGQFHHLVFQHLRSGVQVAMQPVVHLVVGIAEEWSVELQLKTAFLTEGKELRTHARSFEKAVQSSDYRRSRGYANGETRANKNRTSLLGKLPITTGHAAHIKADIHECLLSNCPKSLQSRGLRHRRPGVARGIARRQSPLPPLLANC